jgi:hypothetical protein
MITTNDYHAFIAAKAVVAPPQGFDVDPEEIHPALFPCSRRDGHMDERREIFAARRRHLRQEIRRSSSTPRKWPSTGGLGALGVAPRFRSWAHVPVCCVRFVSRIDW